VRKSADPSTSCPFALRYDSFFSRFSGAFERPHFLINIFESLYKGLIPHLLGHTLFSFSPLTPRAHGNDFVTVPSAVRCPVLWSLPRYRFFFFFRLIPGFILLDAFVCSARILARLTAVLFRCNLGFFPAILRNCPEATFLPCGRIHSDRLKRRTSHH